MMGATDRRMAGKAGTEPFIGILMLDTAFPRIAGDGGNPQSYPFPVRLRKIAGAGPLDIVRDGQPSGELIEAFVEAARQLEAEGAVGIVSTCGFLVSVQHRIASAVSVPVILSALSLYPAIFEAHGQAPVGIITASARQFGNSVMHAAGIYHGRIHIAGMEDVPAFANAILTNQLSGKRHFDSDAIRNAVVAKVKEMQAQEPALGAILLECTNLPPYAEAIRRATGLPVYSILDAAQILWGLDVSGRKHAGTSR
jgi:Asp/Glu/hydantoin racemase